jgi:DNA-binding FadR family transcriptional regulator
VPAEITDPAGVAAQVAAILRDEILSGDLPAGTEAPSQAELAERFGRSPATMLRALGELARDGLIDMGPGRRTTVLPVRAYRVVVTAGPREGGQRPAVARVAAAVRERGAPGLRRVSAGRAGEGLVEIVAVVLAADAGRAGAVAMAAVAGAAGDALDAAGASLSVTPQ